MFYSINSKRSCWCVVKEFSDKLVSYRAQIIYLYFQLLLFLEIHFESFQFSVLFIELLRN